MPLVTPLPLGGLSSEIGSFTDRLQALEALRTSSATLLSLPNVTGLAGTGSYVTPSGWTSLDITVSNTAGIIVFYGGILTAGSLNKLGLFCDSTAVDSTVVTGLSNLGALFGINPIPDGSVFTTLPLGDHTLDLQVLTNVGFSTTLTNVYLMSWSL